MSLDECRRGTTFAKEFRQNHHRDIWNCVISITMYSRCPRCWRCYSGLIRSILRWKEKISFRLAPKAISIMLYAIKHSVLYAYVTWNSLLQTSHIQWVTEITWTRNRTFWRQSGTFWIRQIPVNRTFWIRRFLIEDNVIFLSFLDQNPEDSPMRYITLVLGTKTRTFWIQKNKCVTSCYIIFL